MLTRECVIHLAFIFILTLGERYEAARYISRPDLQPPLFNVTIYDSSRIAPGFWFICPYGDLNSSFPERDLYPQIGPHIFDNHGDLIWSGVFDFDRRGAWDLKVSNFHDAPSLSFIRLPELGQTNGFGADRGFILNSSYKIITEVDLSPKSGYMDLHEFNIIEDNHALVITGHKQWYDLSYLGLGNRMKVDAPGFQEFDIMTQETIFKWNALDFLEPSASYQELPSDHQPDISWDWFHLNSVDKGADGNYLVSSRYTNTVYKVSGLDGSIIWQLGGKNSSFIFEQGVEISHQHDARLFHENDTTTLISLFNNRLDGLTASANYSSAMLIALDHTQSPKVAKVIGQWDAPDHSRTHRGGSMQILPNSNVFINWVTQGHISEFDASGDCLFDAQFSSSTSLRSYRAYKFNFTAMPVEPPALTAYVTGAQSTWPTTLYYISWNGATEVAHWKFYRVDPTSNEISLIGQTARSGFETLYESVGIESYVFAEAIDTDGYSLGNSSVQAIAQFDNSTKPDGSNSNIIVGIGAFVAEHKFAILSAFSVTCFVLIQLAIILAFAWLSRRNGIKYMRLDQNEGK